MTKPYKPYRSKLEQKVAELLGDEWEYEKEKVQYTVKGIYTPDFTRGDRIMIEVKGFFRPGDQRKYLAIAASNPDRELIFVFPNPNKPVRKGAKMTMADWCDKHGFTWYCVDEVAELS